MTWGRASLADWSLIHESDFSLKLILRQTGEISFRLSSSYSARLLSYSAVVSPIHVINQNYTIHFDAETGDEANCLCKEFIAFHHSSIHTRDLESWNGKCSLKLASGAVASYNLNSTCPWTPRSMAMAWGSLGSFSQLLEHPSSIPELVWNRLIGLGSLFALFIAFVTSQCKVSTWRSLSNSLASWELGVKRTWSSKLHF